MYLCNECNEVFDDPVEYREDMNGEGRDFATFSVSPCCGSDYVEAHECNCCINVIPEEEDYCEECLKDFDKAMNEAQKSLGWDYNTFCDMVSHWIDGR